MEIYTEVVYKAKKAHKCHLCCKEIQVGEKYSRESGKWEGEFFDRCSHLHCSEIIRTFCSENRENEYDIDWIIDWLSDKYCYACGERETCEVIILHCEKVLADFKEGDK